MTKGYYRGEPVGPGLRQMRAAAKPGECIACGGPAVPLSDKPSARCNRKRRGVTRTHRDTCGDDICKTAWFRFWRRDQRQPVHHVVPVQLSSWRALRRAAQSDGQRRRWAA